MSIWDQLAAATADLSSASFLHRDQKQNRPSDDEVPFTVGMIALAAKMAKADGVITKDEVFAFKKAFKVSDLEMKQAAHVFNLAKQDVGGYEACAEELAAVFKGDRKMLEYVLEGVFHIGRADGVVHPKEEEFLRQVAKCFGFTDVEFTFMKARHTFAHERNPYDVLGVKPSVSNEELSIQYRRLVAENQPDELMMRGMPKEFILIATEKVAAIDESYKAIAKERGN